jgi:hypothetical protein
MKKECNWKQDLRRIVLARMFRDICSIAASARMIAFLSSFLQTYKLFASQEVIPAPLFCREDWATRQMAVAMKAVLEYEKEVFKRNIAKGDVS